MIKLKRLGRHSQGVAQVWRVYAFLLVFNSLPFYKACWLTSKDAKKLLEFSRFKQANIGEDKDGHMVYLAQSEWFLNTEIANNPDIEFHFTSEIHK